ncbi:hypothetical protein FS837_006382 [Tulasnella sp. UAMH 9824]|nr:hypothetical protein FS837_006382 [Tulasnella sp. UAMH 9824]
MEYSNPHYSPAGPGARSRLPELILDWEPFVIRGRGYVVAEHQTLAIYTVGQIAEIVEVILSFASRPSLYNCALVCKSYHDIAINYLWRRLPSAWPLLRLLGNIQEFQDFRREWRFVTTPSQSNWENFDKFARYVELIARNTHSWSRGTLDYNYNDSAMGDEDTEEGDRCCDRSRCYSGYHIHQTTLDQIVQHQCSARGELRTPLIPNLEHLEFTFSQFPAPHKAFVPFLGPRLKALIISYHGCGWAISYDGEVEPVQRLIWQGIQELAGFEGEIPLERLEISIQTAEYFPLPHQQLDEAFLSALKRYTKLRRVKAPSFVRHDDLVAGLRNLPRLQSLSVTFEGPEVLMSFVKLFAPENPGIRHLELGYRRGNIATPWSILDPLLHCPGLVSLSITAYYGRSPTRLSPWPLPDVYGMSEAWPNLESLTLRPLGVIALEDLEAFRDAGLFPKLKKLTLAIDSIGTTSPSLPVQLSLRSLQSLQVFTMKTLPRTTEKDIPALIKYVARIGTPKTRIELSGHRVDCLCNLCLRVSECHREELKPLFVSPKMIREFMVSTL